MDGVTIVMLGLAFLPSIIGLANLSVEGFVLGFVMSAVAVGAAIYMLPLGIIIWVIAIWFVCASVNRKARDKLERRRHAEMLAAIKAASRS